MKKTYSIELGREARDRVTGFSGILTSRTKFLTGCDQWGITPKADKDGKLGEPYCFDESRIEVTGPGIKLAPAEAAPKRGGPSIKLRSYGK